MLGKRILKSASTSIQKFDLKDTGKLVAIVAASEMMRVSHQTEDSTGAHKCLSTASKTASIAMLIGRALANTLAFTGSTYLFSRLFKDSIEKERKRHNLVIEQLQKAQIEWVHKQQERTALSTGNSDWVKKWKPNLQK